MKNLIFTMSRSILIGLTICLAFLVGACATFEKPTTNLYWQVREQALTKENSGIRVSATLVGTNEAKEIFGIDLSQKGIQAVWLEIENNADRPFIFLPTAMDPEYFAPLEVAHAYHKTFAADANATLDDHLLTLNFPTRSPILPGTSMAGYVFTNRSKGMRVIDIDLLGPKFSQNFTFFVSNPDSTQGQDILDSIEVIYLAAELQNVQTEAALRQALELLPCCVSDRGETSTDEPINVVIIGAIDDWISGLVRRGYRYQPLTPRYVFGRPQDISAQKYSRGYTRPHEHFIRLWKTPILYADNSVWIAQTGTRLGGRFAETALGEVTEPLDPNVDLTRNDLTEDLAYSQALIKIGYVKGSGRPQPIQTDATPKGGTVEYVTDGLRVVLLFAQRPVSLSDIDFFDWERMVDYP